MDLDRLSKIAKSILLELENLNSYDYELSTDRKFMRSETILCSKIKHLLDLSKVALPENSSFFDDSWINWYTEEDTYSYTKSRKTRYWCSIPEAIKMVEYILELINYENKSKSKIKEGKIFEGYEDKMNEASLAIRNEDYQSVINNLNTALELLLKSILKIPTTITSINTSTIIDILVSQDKCLQFPSLNEVRRRVLELDNDVKHRGYAPSQKECLYALKAMQDLEHNIKDIEVSDDLISEVYDKLKFKKNK